MEADLVVLATAIEPSKDARKLATMLTASMDTNDFFTEAHAKLRPVESPTAGVFLSGVCQGPKDIPETVAQAGAAAVKVVGLLAKDKLTTNPCTAESNPLFCNGCASCEKSAHTAQFPTKTVRSTTMESVKPDMWQSLTAHFAMDAVHVPLHVRPALWT